jgi:hypothetical protein
MEDMTITKSFSVGLVVGVEGLSLIPGSSGIGTSWKNIGQG